MLSPPEFGRFTAETHGLSSKLPKGAPIIQQRTCIPLITIGAAIL